MRYLNCKLFAAALFAVGTLCASAQSLYRTPYSFANFAGAPGGAGSSDGNGTNARFLEPRGIALDSAGNAYVADYYNFTIRKIDTAGNVTTIAGTAGVGGSADGQGGAASFYYPGGVAVDSAGNIYVADEFNYTIRRIDSAYNVTTVAGVAQVSGNTDGNGANALFNTPNGIAFDRAGNLYIADESNHAIRKMDTAGNVITLAGTSGTAGDADGNGTSASFDLPTGVAVDSAGNVYVADYYNCTIRKIDTAANVTTFAGSAGLGGSTDAQGNAARFYYPTGVGLDSAGNLYVADYFNDMIRKIDTAANVTTLAGLPQAAGSADGIGAAARFSQPFAVAVNSAGVLYVTDQVNCRITRGVLAPIEVSSATRSYLQPTVVLLEFTLPVAPATATNLSNYALNDNGTITGAILNPDGSVTLTTSPLYNNVAHILTLNNVQSTNGSTIANNSTIQIVLPSATPPSASIYATPYAFTNFAGLPGSPGGLDGLGDSARFIQPHGITVDSAGNVYVADELTYTIRKITPDGNVMTIAGTAGMGGDTDGQGANALFFHPTGVAVDSTGNIFVADYDNFTIRKIDTAGNVTTFAGGSGVTGSTDGNGTNALFYYPNSVALDSAGNLYVADELNQEIRKIDTAANVTTLAGSPESSGSADGTGSAARFSYPNGVTVDSSNNVYTADTVNNTIRKISPAGVVTTIAGTAGATGSADGNGAAARFFYPRNVALDKSGNLYIADESNQEIRKLDTNGNVTTLAGTAGMAGSADGVGSAARFADPFGIAVDSQENLYVADYANDRITKGVLSSVTLVSATRDFLQPSAVTVVFSQMPVASTATNVSNYSLNNGAVISAATLNLDGSVTLATSPIFDNLGYVLTVNNVQGATGLTIAGNSQIAVGVPGSVARGEYNLNATNEVVVLEAEDYDLNTAAGGTSWVFTTLPPLLSPTDANTNFSGTGAMAAEPISGIDLGNPALGEPVANSPHLEYTVQFTNTGTFYTWVRGVGDGSPGPGASDSVFVGLDNALATAITGFPQGQGYTWANTPVAAGLPLVVTSAGYHTVDVWMRQDGFTVDKLLLTSSAAYTPTNNGPGESQVAAPVITATKSGSSLVLSWSAGELQSSTNVAGPYVDVQESGSPYTVTTSGPQQYYRIQQ